MKIRSLHRLNRWYDALPEPRRFLTMFAPMAVLMWIGRDTIWLWLVMGIIGIYRWHYLTSSS